MYVLNLGVKGLTLHQLMVRNCVLDRHRSDSLFFFFPCLSSSSASAIKLTRLGRL